MKIGDFITVVYYNPPTSEYSIFRIYYGKITNISRNLIDYEIFAEIRTDIRKMSTRRCGSFKTAMLENVYAINSSFGLSCIDDCRKFGESYHRPSKSA